MKNVWRVGMVIVVVAFATVAGAAQDNTMVLYGAPDRDWVAAVAAKF
jgi:hypothetical protein